MLEATPGLMTIPTAAASGGLLGTLAPYAGAGGDFAAALTELMQTAAGADDTVVVRGGRQALAAGGKIVPPAPIAPPALVVPDDTAILPIGDDDDTKPAVAAEQPDPTELRLEPALAWLMPPVPMPPPMPLPRLRGLPTPAAETPATTVTEMVPDALIVVPASKPTTAAPLPARQVPAELTADADPPTEITPPVPPKAMPTRQDVFVMPPAAARPGDRVAPPVASLDRSGTAQSDEVSPPTIASAAADPRSQQPQGARERAPLSVVRHPPVAPAIATTSIEPHTGARSAVSADAVSLLSASSIRRASDEPAWLEPAAAAPLTGPAPLAPQPVAAAAQPGIDLTRDPGLHRMIDRIEQLRDAADARDTRIRLIPDALGPVEIAVRRDGGTVQVHFTAPEPETRQLIADAQPRLSELAEQRGLRIERATVDGDAGGGGGQPRPHSQPALNRAPAPIAAPADDPVTDERIA